MAGVPQPYFESEIVARNGAGAHPSQTAPELVRGGAETILLVEDEVSVRRTVGQCLRRLGYQVIEAGTGKEALDLWPKHRQEIDLALH
jgi:response regulator RpfG family c-di-GMP phosphodiesterase